MTVQPRLSVCMIVKNEEHHMVEALSNYLAFADEIVVVDTGSSDATAGIARQFTPHVHHFPWIDDFSAARNRSLELATGRYFLWLDADDRFEAEMIERINAMKDHFDGRKGFYILLENVHASGPHSFCYQLRCVPLREDIRFEGRIHEQLLSSATRCGLDLATTDITVRHIGYMDHGLCLSKMRRNLALLRKDLEEGRDDVGVHYFLALSYAAIEMDAEAVAAMEKAIRKMESLNFDHATLLEGYLFLGKIHEKKGDEAKLLRAVTRASALVDHSPQHHYHLGVLYQKLGRHTQAVACFENTRGRPYQPNLYPSRSLPPREEICLAMAHSLFSLGKTSPAMERLREAWDLGLGVAESWEELGYRALASSRAQFALHAYEAANRAGDLSADGWCNLGTLYRRESFTEKALHCYGTALQRDPHHSVAMANLAHLHLNRGDWREAERLFLHLSSNGSTDLHILLSLALIAAAHRRSLGDVRRLYAQIMDDPLLETIKASSAEAPAPDLAHSFHRLAAHLSARQMPRLAAIAEAIEKVLGRATSSPS